MTGLSQVKSKVEFIPREDFSGGKDTQPTEQALGTKDQRRT